MSLPRARSGKFGSAMIAVIVYLLIVSSLSAAFFATLHRTIAQARAAEHHTQCRYLAEAGVEKALAELQVVPGTYRGERNTALGPGIFSVEVSPEAPPGAYRIHATGALTDGQSVLAKGGVTAEVALAGTRITRLCWEEVHR